jgi:hypothetical protein
VKADPLCELSALAWPWHGLSQEAHLSLMSFVNWLEYVYSQRLRCHATNSHLYHLTMLLVNIAFFTFLCMVLLSFVFFFLQIFQLSIFSLYLFFGSEIKAGNVLLQDNILLLQRLILSAEIKTLLYTIKTLIQA